MRCLTSKHGDDRSAESVTAPTWGCLDYLVEFPVSFHLHAALRLDG